MLIALLLAQAAMAMPPAPVCAAPAAPPAIYAGWNIAAPIAAAAEPAGVGDAVLTIGRGARATLQPAAVLKLPVAPGKPLAAAAHGGLFAVQVATTGRYRVALGAGAWVEMVADGVAIASAAHGHGPDCSPVKKFVDWDLKPGRYLLQVTGGEATTLQLEIVKPA